MAGGRALESSREDAPVAFLVMGDRPGTGPRRSTTAFMNVPGLHMYFTVMEFLLHFALVLYCFHFDLLGIHHVVSRVTLMQVWCDLIFKNHGTILVFLQN